MIELSKLAINSGARCWRHKKDDDVGQAKRRRAEIEQIKRSQILIGLPSRRSGDVFSYGQQGR